MPHLALLLTAVLASSSHPATTQDSAARAMKQRVDKFVQPYVASNNFTGVILVRREGRVQLNQGYGMANYELGVANSPESRFHIASVTKAFTAAAALLLAERGKLSLEDPVSRYLPDYPQGDRIRIEHLLKHTAGIPNLGSGPGGTLRPQTDAERRTECRLQRQRGALSGRWQHGDRAQ